MHLILLTIFPECLPQVSRPLIVLDLSLGPKLPSVRQHLVGQRLITLASTLLPTLLISALVFLRIHLRGSLPDLFRVILKILPQRTHLWYISTALLNPQILSPRLHLPQPHQKPLEPFSHLILCDTVVDLLDEIQ